MPSRKRKTCSRICQLKFSLTGKKKTEQHKLNMRYANAWKYTKEILIDYIKGDAILWIAKKYKSDKRTIRQVLKEQGIGVFRGRKGIQAWNKGLNQFIDKRVAKWAGENNPNSYVFIMNKYNCTIEAARLIRKERWLRKF